MKAKFYILHLFVLVIILPGLNRSLAQTPVSGGIYSNTTWSLANSPYVMTGDIVVFPGVTLTIEPGVEVLVRETPTPGSEYYLETRGTINMVGQPGARILFRAENALTQVGAWSGIRVKSSQGGVLNADYVSISNAIFAYSYDGPEPPVFVFNDSEFRFNAYAVSLGTSLIADSCTFYGNSSAISGWSVFQITNCEFDSNAAAMAVYPSSISIENSVFRRNSVGINLASVPFSPMSILNSEFTDNTTAVDNAGNGIVSNCTFTGNDGGLVNTSQLNVDSCSFFENQLAVQAGFGTLVRQCIINDNEVGVAIGPLSFGQPMPIIENNQICNNAQYNVENRTDLNTFIPTNCFCITDSAAVEQKILDGYDDITRGLVSYAIFDTTCTNVLAIVNKVPGTTGVFEVLEDQMSVFPNPGAGPLFFDGFNENVVLRLFDSSGRQVYNHQHRTDMPWDALVGLSPGVYHLQIIRENGAMIAKRLLRL
jgi:hypothetical protein